MNVLYIEETLVITSSAPGKMFRSGVVCFQDAFFIVLKVPATTFHVNQNPEAIYGFGDMSIDEGVQYLIDNSNSEEELKAKLLEHVKGNNTLMVNFSDWKKVKISGFLGTKTLKAKNSSLSYISFNATKNVAKQLVEFYPNL